MTTAVMLSEGFPEGPELDAKIAVACEMAASQAQFEFPGRTIQVCRSSVLGTDWMVHVVNPGNRALFNELISTRYGEAGVLRELVTIKYHRFDDKTGQVRVTDPDTPTPPVV